MHPTSLEKEGRKSSRIPRLSLPTPFHVPKEVKATGPPWVGRFFSETVVLHLLPTHGCASGRNTKADFMERMKEWDYSGLG